MSPRISIITAVAVLLLAAGVHADKGYDGSMALSYECESCTYLYTDHVLNFLDSMHQNTRHAFRIDTYDHWTDEIHFNVDINAIFGYYPNDTFIISFDSVFIDYDSVLVDTLVYNASMGQHLHYKLYLPDSSQFDGNDTLLILNVRYMECTVYLDYGLGFDIVHNGTIVGKRNGFYDAIDRYFYEIPEAGLTDGFRGYEEANAKLVLVPDPPPIDDWADSSYVGGSVGLAVYASDLNFYYSGGYEFTLRHVSGITFDHIDTTVYSSNPTIDTIDDSTYTFSLASYDGPSPVELDRDTFLTVWFDIDTDADANTKYKAWIDGAYIFDTDCYWFADTTTNGGNEYYNVKTVKEWLSLKFATAAGQVGDTIVFRYFASNSAPVFTDNTTGGTNASFAFDNRYTPRTEYTGLRSNFPYNNGTLYWQDDFLGNGDSVRVNESTNNNSDELVASLTVYDTVGYLKIRCISNGTDYYKFIDRTADTLNYFVIKHTQDTMFVDSIVGGNGYGDLELIKGSVVVSGGTGGGGCPKLYAWDGDGYTLENPILTHSQGKLDPQPADDFYPFSFGVAEEGGYYKVQIRERENEISFIDQAQLIVVDHPRESQVGISSDGQVFTYQRSVEPIAAVDEWGRDLMPYVGKLDDRWMDVNYPGSMILTYPNPFHGQPSYRFALTDDPPDPPQKKKINPDNTDGQGDNIIAEIEDIHGNWFYLGAIPPREYQSENSKWLFDSQQAELGETFRVKISWRVAYQADLQALKLSDDSYILEERLSPRFAEHSEFGTVTPALTAIDDDILTLKPGEQVELRFKVPGGTGEKGYARKFFFKAHGYYKTFTPEDALPTAYALEHNYPNPFNPTTSIGFSLPIGGDMSLVVYNILGQEVKTLYRGYMEAGNHRIDWGGDNNAGEPVASGVYFYRLKAGSFEQSRKMTLLK